MRLTRDLPLHRLPPLKLRALEALARGPITGAWNAAWHAFDGSEFNTHTMLWLRDSGLATMNAGRTEVRANQATVAFLAGAEAA